MPGPPHPRAEGGLRLRGLAVATAGYFKLDTPSGPLLSGISVLPAMALGQLTRHSANYP